MDKRHFTVVIGSKEHGLYVSSTPSSAAKKAVSKLCSSNKSKKVEFSLRETTQGSKKKTYGPYLGEMKKLKTPIELKGRVIRYETIVKLKKDKMQGGNEINIGTQVLEVITKEYRDNLFEMNNFNEILQHIFNSHDELVNLAGNSREDIIRLINFIEREHPTENKYYFIICTCFCFTDSRCDIIEYLISKLGLNRLIQIVYATDYDSLFNRIIFDIYREGMIYNVTKLDERKILVTKNLVYEKLLECYSQKTLEEFKEILIKLFSIQDKSFINLNSFEFFFTHSIQLEGFILFEFLLEKKGELIDFINFIKPEINHWYSREARKKIGTAEQQLKLFNR